MSKMLFAKHQIGIFNAILASHSSNIHEVDQFRGVILNDYPLISSECIDLDEQCQELIHHVIEISKIIPTIHHQNPLRISSVQIGSVVHEWNLIQEQHRRFVKIQQTHPRIQISHSCISSIKDDLLFDAEAPSEFKQKAILEILKQFNAEALLIYCSWFNQECEKVNKTILRENSEEYQLQALLDDFSHEVHSPLLVASQGILAKIIIDQEKAIVDRDDEQLLSLEKQVILNRMELIPALLIQNELIRLIIENISKIEDAHPELLLLKRQGLLLHEVINNCLRENSWSQEKRLLFIELLNQELNVVPMISCGRGMDRTNFSFALQLALCEMRQQYPFDEVLKMCVGWDKKVFIEPIICREFKSMIQKNLDFFQQKL